MVRSETPAKFADWAGGATYAVDCKGFLFPSWVCRLVVATGLIFVAGGTAISEILGFLVLALGAHGSHLFCLFSFLDLGSAALGRVGGTEDEAAAWAAEDVVVVPARLLTMGRMRWGAEQRRQRMGRGLGASLSWGCMESPSGRIRFPGGRQTYAGDLLGSVPSALSCETGPVIGVGPSFALWVC